MSTVPRASGSTEGSGWDPLRRRVEFADVFAGAAARAEVDAVVALIRRGLIAVEWIRELFAPVASELVDGVRSLDRDALREAYALLFVEEPLITNAIRDVLASADDSSGLPVYVQDAVSEVVGAATCVTALARAWTWFMFGEIED